MNITRATQRQKKQIEVGSTLIEIYKTDFDTYIITVFIAGLKSFEFETQVKDIEEIKNQYVCIVDDIYFYMMDFVCETVIRNID